MDHREFETRETFKQAGELEELHLAAMSLGTREEYARAEYARQDRRLGDAMRRWIHDAKVARFSGDTTSRDLARDVVVAQLETVTR